MMRVLTLVALVLAAPLAVAGQYTSCAGWLVEPALFECSTGASYAQGDAQCTTLNNSRMLFNLFSRPKPTLIFCKRSLADDVRLCSGDESAETLTCFAEFRRLLKDPKKPAPPVEEAPAVMASF